MCAIEDAEPFQFCRKANIKRAAKSHTCTECYRTINLGEPYTYIAGVIDDRWESYYTCRHCDAAGTWLDVVCSGYPLTMLRDELDEHRTEFPTSTVLDQLWEAVEAKWSNGEAPIPDAVEIQTDARRCMEALTA
jgi:hypothetical protein